MVYCGFERQDAVPDDFVILGRGIGPERFDRVPEWMAESLDVGVAVLRDYRFDARRVGEGETQTDRGAIVEYVHGVGDDVQRCEEGADCQA